MTLAESPLLPGFIVFCRVGGCVMTAPGLSSERIPMRSRLYIALGVSLALAPPLMDELRKAVDPNSPASILLAILAESVIGVALGLLARFYFLALETLATSIAMSFGLGNIFGGAIAESDAAPALTSFVVTAAVTLLFLADIHLELIRGLGQSYETAPVSASFAPAALLEEMSRALTQSHLLALKICSPFLLFALILNVAVGLLARVTPQVQVYFISGPLTILLGLYAFLALSRDFFTGFISYVARGVSHG